MDRTAVYDFIRIVHIIGERKFKICLNKYTRTERILFE